MSGHPVSETGRRYQVVYQVAVVAVDSRTQAEIALACRWFKELVRLLITAGQVSPPVARSVCGGTRPLPHPSTVNWRAIGPCRPGSGVGHCAYIMPARSRTRSIAIVAEMSMNSSTSSYADVTCATSAQLHQQNHHHQHHQQHSWACLDLHRVPTLYPKKFFHDFPRPQSYSTTFQA